MVEVEIEYCVPCGLLDSAVAVQRELLETFGGDLDAVSLTTGHGGVFEVSVDDETVWDANEHEGAVDSGFIVGEVGDRIGTGT